MTDTASLLYRYLRLLSVRVDRGTVRRLLDHPLGDSMRGLSDALDALGVKNAAYQLPADYLDQVETPFIAVTRQDDNSFCLVEQRKGEGFVVFTEGKRMTVNRESFLRQWTGGVLLGEVTESTRQDPWYVVKNGCDWLLRHSLSTTYVLLLLMMLWETEHTLWFYDITLWMGTFASAAILYKEWMDSRFLHRFCHIGQTVDCDAVLRSKGSRLAGVGLGELSLLYFATLLLSFGNFPLGLDGWTVCCGLSALVFTIYSVVYQAFVVRKGCVLCMAVNVSVWLNSLSLYLFYAQEGMPLSFSFSGWVSLVLSAGIVLGVGLTVKRWTRASQGYRQLQARYAGLLQSETFQALLALQPVWGDMPEKDLCLHNGLEGTDEILIVTNPTCENCARLHPQLSVLATHAPTFLLLLTFPQDKTGQRVAQATLAAYRTQGWEKAFDTLSHWFETGKLPMDAVQPTEEDMERWKRQQLYAYRHQLTRTPSLYVDGRYVPEVYEVRDLRYVLT